MLGYSASQLLRYHRHCVNADPRSRVLPPGGQRNWHEMTAMRWLLWFRECLTNKINRTLPASGNGNRAKRRAAVIADSQAECKWCGQKTGSARKPFCEASCQRSYYS